MESVRVGLVSGSQRRRNGRPTDSQLDSPAVSLLRLNHPSVVVEVETARSASPESDFHANSHHATTMTPFHDLTGRAQPPDRGRPPVYGEKVVVL